MEPSPYLCVLSSFHRAASANCRHVTLLFSVQLSQLLQQALLPSTVLGSEGHPAEQQQRAGAAPEGGSTEKHGPRSGSHHSFQRGHAVGALPTRLL